MKKIRKLIYLDLIIVLIITVLGIINILYIYDEMLSKNDLGIIILPFICSLISFMALDIEVNKNKESHSKILIFFKNKYIMIIVSLLLSAGYLFLSNGIIGIDVFVVILLIISLNLYPYISKMCACS